MDNLTQLFTEAGTLMLTGMVFVFTFLGLLVVFINTVLVRLAHAYPDPVVQRGSQPNSTNKNEVQDGVSPSVVAAISSAVTKYRQQHSKK
ncbi:OadG family transporter subunit [Thalassotalea piscium]|uniref:Probable oxaloacetate decarboxylase gamma chain n=1 Tax=Thalassotalea piscium TaxID=1230533 RepID=A0A7X0NGD2_9GAMM|nr:OadG family transporter subunit [Thalassotalea piscium]MBB6542964.1 oxaloacetate decarboxylase gamma subunit [Thalassotalea piscium]